MKSQSVRAASSEKGKHASWRCSWLRLSSRAMAAICIRLVVSGARYRSSIALILPPLPACGPDPALPTVRPPIDPGDGGLASWTRDEAHAAIGRLIERVPGDVQLGLHLCFGDSNRDNFRPGVLALSTLGGRPVPWPFLSRGPGRISSRRWQGLSFRPRPSCARDWCTLGMAWPGPATGRKPRLGAAVTFCVAALEMLAAELAGEGLGAPSP